jgi:hypothetical protein
MKPRLKFTTDGEYTGDYTGNVAINGSLDEFNRYMRKLGQIDLCLYRFSRDPFIIANAMRLYQI